MGLLVVSATISALLGTLAWRLLRSAGKLGPEKVLGCSFAIAALGITPRLLGARFAREAPHGDAAVWLVSLGEVALAAATIGVLVFVWRVFRSEDPWARWLAGGLATAVVGASAMVLLSPTAERELSVPMLVANAIRPLPLLWAFVECFRYARLMARRVGLGLADPVVADRFRLWAVWTGALGAAPLLILPIRLAGVAALRAGETPSPLLLPIAAAVTGVLVPAAVVAVWLSFFPPQRYLDRLSRRAAASMPTTAS